MDTELGWNSALGPRGAVLLGEQTRCEAGDGPWSWEWLGLVHWETGTFGSSVNQTHQGALQTGMDSASSQHFSCSGNLVSTGR